MMDGVEPSYFQCFVGEADIASFYKYLWVFIIHSLHPR